MGYHLLSSNLRKYLKFIKTIKFLAIINMITNLYYEKYSMRQDVLRKLSFFMYKKLSLTVYTKKHTLYTIYNKIFLEYTIERLNTSLKLKH